MALHGSAPRPTLSCNLLATTRNSSSFAAVVRPYCRSNPAPSMRRQAPRAARPLRCPRARQRSAGELQSFLRAEQQRRARAPRGLAERGHCTFQAPKGHAERGHRTFRVPDPPHRSAMRSTNRDLIAPQLSKTSAEPLAVGAAGITASAASAPIPGGLAHRLSPTATGTPI